jgi:outer membrane usher protein FimD/PapC
MFTDNWIASTRTRRSPEDHKSPGILRFSALLVLLVTGGSMTAHALVTTPTTHGALRWHDNEANRESWEWTSHNSNSNSNSNANSNSNSSSQSHSESHTTVITYSDNRTDSHSYQYSESGSRHHRDDPCTVSQVPLPAALPLFLSALAMLGLGGWARRRRAA